MPDKSLLVVERDISLLGAFPVAWLLIRDASRYSCREGAYDSADKSQDPLFIAPQNTYIYNHTTSLVDNHAPPSTQNNTLSLLKRHTPSGPTICVCS